MTVRLGDSSKSLLSKCQVPLEAIDQDLTDINIALYTLQTLSEIYPLKYAV